jgi:hypothetical protein
MKNNRYNELLVSKDLEYSQENTKYIDERIWKVCDEAAANYNKIQNAVRQKENLKQFDIVLEDVKVKKQNNIQIQTTAKAKNKCDTVKPLIIKDYNDESNNNIPVFNKYYNNKNNESSSYLSLNDTEIYDKSVDNIKNYKEQEIIPKQNINTVSKMLKSNRDGMMKASNGIKYNYTKTKTDLLKSNEMIKSKAIFELNNKGVDTKKSLGLNHKHIKGKICFACELKKK